MSTVRILAFSAASACASLALAQAIDIANPSFEFPELSAGSFTSTSPDGWTGPSGSIGVFYPTVSTWGYVASDGDQLAYTNSGAIMQTLDEVVRPGVEYALMVDIIHRPGFYNTYKVELLAGDTVVAVDDGVLNPPSGGSKVSVVVYRAQPDDPQVGQPLTIRLSGPTQGNFDNVRMTTCRADLDGDGSLTVFDFLAYQNLFASGDFQADFQADCTLDIFDYLAFLNSFSGGCG